MKSLWIDLGAILIGWLVGSLMGINWQSPVLMFSFFCSAFLGFLGYGIMAWNQLKIEQYTNWQR